ncbi:hypothetical protein JIN81_02110 [Haloferula rosea]|uniref:FecR protein n=1 Tax=Haloferula rosea TaxID=490093 RepID=A0A934VD11_9BACT|nr:hypothetical protein [Haloferula rosea]
MFEGRLTGAPFEELQTALRKDTSAREAYREYLHLHHSLKFRSSGVDLLNVVPMDRVIERGQRRTLRQAGLAAAALLVLVGVTMALILTRAPAPTLSVAASPGTDFTIGHERLGDEAPNGLVLEPGSRLQLKSGTVELDFTSGVRGIVRGPADLTLQREDLLEFSSGTAWFEVPAKAIGFKVNTPDLLLTDLGTEFGIVSAPNFLDEVHVFSGMVEVQNRSGLMTKELLTEGQARFAGLAGRWKEIPIRPDHFLNELPITETQPEVLTHEQSSYAQFAFVDDVSNSDLLHGLKARTFGWNQKNDASPLELTDGVHGDHNDVVPGDRVQGAWTTVGAVAEYELGRGATGRGYDITSIQSIASWNNAGFGNQAWTVEVKPVGGDYRILHTVSFHPLNLQALNGGGATKVTLTHKDGVLAGGIEFIRFTASHVEGSVDNAFVWREIDVFGHLTGQQ